MDNGEIKKKPYELAFLVREEEDVNGVQKLLNAHGAEIIREPMLKKIALSYKIEKQTSAIFGFVQFSMTAENIKLLEQELRTTPAVFRSLIMSLTAKSENKSASEGRPRTARVVKSSPERKPAAPVLSNEALEKKIEEILQ